MAIFKFTVDGFVPSTALLLFADFAALPIALLGLALVGLAQRRELIASWQARQFKNAFQTAASVLICPLLVVALWYAFVAGPVSYGLHRLEPTAHTLTRLSVTRAFDSGRRCGNRAELESHSFRWERKLCHLPSATTRRLAQGGELEIEATVSAYGFQVGRSRLDIAR